MYFSTRIIVALSLLLLLSAPSASYAQQTQTLSPISTGCRPITQAEIEGIRAMGATIPTNGQFCDKDKPLLYGSCPESPYPYLQTKNKTGRPDTISGLNSDFACRLYKFMKAADGAGMNITIGSGYRSVQHQTQLYNAYVAGGKRGAPVAAPGRSKHNFGLAVDLRYDGQHSNFSKGAGNTPECIRRLKSCKWAHENYSKFGLRYPMAVEPWHAEPSGAVSGKAQPTPQGGGWQSDSSATPYTGPSGALSDSPGTPLSGASPLGQQGFSNPLQSLMQPLLSSLMGGAQGGGSGSGGGSSGGGSSGGGTTPFPSMPSNPIPTPSNPIPTPSNPIPVGTPGSNTSTPSLTGYGAGIDPVSNLIKTGTIVLPASSSDPYQAILDMNSNPVSDRIRTSDTTQVAPPLTLSPSLSESVGGLSVTSNPAQYPLSRTPSVNNLSGDSYTVVSARPSGTVTLSGNDGGYETVTARPSGSSYTLTNTEYNGEATTSEGGSALAPQTFSSGSTNDAKTIQRGNATSSTSGIDRGILISILEAMRNVLVSILISISNSTNYGFSGSWQSPANTPAR